MAVVIIAVVTVAVSVVALSPAILLALMLWVPVCAFAQFIDAHVLNTWRADLLECWNRQELELSALALAIRANHSLPRQTLEGMLATLPMSPDLGAEQRVSTPTRRALGAAVHAIHHAQSDAILLTAVTSLIATCSLAVSVWTWTPVWLWGLTAVALFPLVRWWTYRRRFAIRDREMASHRVDPRFSETDYARIGVGLR